MFEISKKDWKLFRERLPEWQEQFMGRLTKEYIDLLKGDEDASERFWNLEKRINQDKILPGVSVQMSKREAVYTVIRLLEDGAITIKQLDGFSEEFIEEVRSHFLKDERSE